MVGEDDDLYDEDDEMMVMAIADGLDCIGCKACSAVCRNNAIPIRPWP